MTLKDRLASHPIIVYFGVFLLGGSSFVSLLTPVMNDRRESAVSEVRQSAEKKIGALEESLSSINRGLGGTAETIDVESMMVEPQETGSVPAASKFFVSDHFYALSSSLPGEPTHEVTTELDLLTDLTGRSAESLLAELRKSGVRREQLTAFPVHLWRKGNGHALDGAPIAKVSTQIFVQRVPNSAIIESVEPVTPGLTSDPNDPLSSLANFYRGDSTGFFLVTQLNVELAIAGPPHSNQLSTIEKKGNLVYARFDTTFRDIVVDGREVDEYFWIREVLLISTPEDLYLVKTFLPTTDPRPDLWISRWLAAFRIVTAS